MIKEEINVNEIAKIEELPKIIIQVKKIGQYIDEATKDLDKLVCTEEMKQVVKVKRAEINNFAKALEDKRKEIKKQILEPYTKFEEVYNEECKDKLTNASELLGNKINEIETKQKEEKEQELREFFKQYQETYHLEDVVKFEDVGLNITLSASMKSLKDEIVCFCERINKDILVINNDENKEEVLLEYLSNGFDYQQAKLTLYDRKRKIQELAEKQKEVANKVAEEILVSENIELTGAPQEVINDDEILEATFTVKATKEQLKELKQWLEERNIEYA